MRNPTGLVVICLLLVVSSLPAGASQQLGHMYVALTAFAGAPPELFEVLYANLGSYVAGAVGPDICLLTYPEDEMRGASHPGDWPHYRRTGQLVMNLLRLAATPAEQAFAWGWLTHYMTDNVVHPVVNQFGGYYTGDGMSPSQRQTAKERHILLELFENRHIMESAAPTRSYYPHRYRLDSDLVPIDLVVKAYDATYTEGAPVGFAARLGTAAYAMEVTIGSFLAETSEGAKRSLLSRALSVFPGWVLGEMPTAEEYEQLMEPLVVTDAAWVRDADGQESLRIAYDVNDIRLLRGFADQVDGAYLMAAANIEAAMGFFGQPPADLRLVNTNLDTGLPVEQIFDPDTAFPGNPDLFYMLVTCSIRDKDGQEHSPFAAGDWVDFPYLDKKIWGGPAGTGVLEIPFTTSYSGPYEVNLELVFAHFPDKRPYMEPNDDARWQGIIGEEIRWHGHFSVNEYSGLADQMVPTWQGPLNSPLPLVLVAHQGENFLDVIAVEPDSLYYDSRGALFLLTPHWFSQARTYQVSGAEAAEQLIAMWRPHWNPREESLPPWLEQAIAGIAPQAEFMLLQFDASMDTFLRSPEHLRFLGMLDLETKSVSGVYHGEIEGTRDIFGIWTAQGP